MALKNLFLLGAAALFVVRCSATACATFKCPSNYIPSGASATTATTADCCTQCAPQNGIGRFGVGIDTATGGNTRCADCHPECERCSSRSECNQCARADQTWFGQYARIEGRCDWTCDRGYRVNKDAFGVSTYIRGTSASHRCAECGGNGMVSAGCAKCESTDDQNSNDKCLTCATDYTMPPGCSRCTQKTLSGDQTCDDTNCDDGYLSISGVCHKCGANCKTCGGTGGTVSDLNDCQSCIDGYTPDSNNVCQKCGTNMKTCVIANLNSGTCVDYTTIQGAVAFSGGTCELNCGDFYKKVGNTCQPCPVVAGAQCPKCDRRQCDAPGTGARCSDGKHTAETGAEVDAGMEGVCKKLAGDNTNCAGKATEAACTAASGLQTASDTCEWVNDHNMATCTGDCISNCDACDDDHTLCDDGKCKEGYVQNDLMNACDKCGINNCAKCTHSRKATECDDCLNGYYGEGCDKRCSTMPNCLTCSRGGHFCRTCSDESPARGVAHSCSHASMTGDPHVTNLRGEKFDVMQSGKHSLVCLPRGHCGTQNNLHVEVMVARLSGGSCESAFVQDLTLEGKWVGHAITISAGTLRKEKPFGLTSEKFYSFKELQKEALTKHNGKTMTIVGLKTSRETIAVDFEGVKISVEHVSHPHLSFLNVNAQGLLKQDVEVGGLLGLDGHKDAATAPSGCKHKVRAHRGESDILASELIGN